MSERGRTGPASPGSCLPGGTASKAIWELRRAAAHTQRARNESRHAAAVRLLYGNSTSSRPPRGETRCQKAQQGSRRAVPSPAGLSKAKSSAGRTPGAHSAPETFKISRQQRGEEPTMKAKARASQKTSPFLPPGLAGKLAFLSRAGRQLWRGDSSCCCLPSLPASS